MPTVANALDVVAHEMTHGVFRYEFIEAWC